jgi:hypothetical protein
MVENVKALEEPSRRWEDKINTVAAEGERFSQLRRQSTGELCGNISESPGPINAA